MSERNPVADTALVIILLVVFIMTVVDAVKGILAWL